MAIVPDGVPSELGNVHLFRVKGGTGAARKNPATKRGFKDAVPFARYMAEHGTLEATGLATGAVSGVSVLDVDSPAALVWLVDNFPDAETDLESTYSVETIKGFHFYFRHDPALGSDNTRLRDYTGEPLDVRGTGGYVCFRIEDQYRHTVKPLKPVPGWLLQLVNDANAAYRPKLTGDIESDGRAIEHADIVRLSEVGLGESGHDTGLATLVYALVSRGYAKGAIREAWDAAIDATVLTGEPFTDRDFERHWSGADRKIGCHCGGVDPFCIGFMFHAPQPTPTVEPVKVARVGQAGRLPAPPEELQAKLAEVWDLTPTLRTIRQAALSRMLSPYSVLAVTLLRAVGCVPPEFKLPAIRGAEGSLNQFYALVGKSGSGKSASVSTSQDFVTFERANPSDDLFDAEAFGPSEPHHANLGSGEGVVSAFGSADREGVWEWRHRSVVFNTDDVDMLGSQMARAGSTIREVLLTCWVGGSLGFSYRGEGKGGHAPKHGYRMGLLVGCQPGRGDVLLAGDTAGLPQRFAWWPAWVWDMPALGDIPAAPQPITIALDAYPLTGLFPVAQSIRYMIQENAHREVSGDTAALDGHALFTRLKLAAAFAVLANDAEITAEHWGCATVLMELSSWVRDVVVDEVHAERAKRAAERGRDRATERAYAADEDSLIASTRTWALGKLKSGEVSSYRGLQNKCSKGRRRVLRQVWDGMVENGLVTEAEPGEWQAT